MAFSLNDALKNVMQSAQDFSNKATSNIVNNQIKEKGFSSQPNTASNDTQISTIDFESNPFQETRSILQSNLPTKDKEKYMETDEYFDSLFQPYERSTGSGNIDNVPAIADYNGFNFNDFPAEMYQGNKDSNYEGIEGAAKDFYGTDAKSYAQQAEDLGDAERAAWENYLANTNLGSKYSGTGDFQLNGTYNEWRDAILSDELSQYYGDIFNEYGGSKEAFDFDRYWNDYKPVELMDVINDNAMVQKYLGTSAGNIDDFSAYLAANVGYDDALNNLFGNNSESNYDLASAMNSYKFGDMILQNMLANGMSSDDFMKEFTVGELNQLFRQDPSMFTTDANDSEGSLVDWGKTGNEYHDTDFNAAAYNLYNGAPYAGLADTVTALAGDKLYHKTRPVSQEGQE